MEKLSLAFAALFVVAAVTSLGQAEDKAPAALNFKMKTLAGKEVDLAKYKGKVVLIVNTASECGLTPQYEQLQALHTSLSDKGLAVIGVPCNQFGGQEPGTAEEIGAFCKENYGVTFDMLAKVDVNGDGACPLYKYLTAVETKPKKAGEIGWNFEKFVLDRKGNVVGRFAPDTSPDDPALVKLIETQLSAK
jgi:glutathione peroxidase